MLFGFETGPFCHIGFFFYYFGQKFLGLLNRTNEQTFVVVSNQSYDDKKEEMITFSLLDNKVGWIVLGFFASMFSSYFPLDFLHWLFKRQFFYWFLLSVSPPLLNLGLGTEIEILISKRTEKQK